MSITPYTISIPQPKLDRLKQKLELTELPTQFEPTPGNNVPWDFGAPVSEIKRLVEYWKDGFDWRKAEEKLNELPMFWTEVDVKGFEALGMHFVHQKSDKKDAIPLLFSHGWPGSFLEVSKLLPLLTSPQGNGPSFHVVAPSLPNFGFSSGVASKGFGLGQYAEAMHKVMLKLGYDRYVTQGGDWGYSVTRTLGLLYPDHVLASHISLVLAQPPDPTKHPVLYAKYTATPAKQREIDGEKRSKWFEDEGYGYNLLQSTKPQTIGFALADSPVAILSWIYEKLHDWTDSYPWTDDEILTWISIYWFSTAGPAASTRIYHVATRPDPSSERPISTTMLASTYIPRVKLGIAHFPKEISVRPHSWAETLGPVVGQYVHERGGHFSTWEVPEEIAVDLREMFGQGGPCHGIMGG